MTDGDNYENNPGMISQQKTGPDFSALPAGLRLAGFLVLVAILVPIHMVYSTIKPQDALRFPKFFHQVLIRILGFHVRVHGAMAATTPILFVSNHSS